MSDKIVIRSLPTDGDTPVDRRIVQDRGELALLENGETFSRLAYFSLKAGEGLYRGGHWHKAKAERFYMISGRVEIACADLDSGEKFRVTAEAGDKGLILPRLAHRFRALEDAQVVEYCDTTWEPGDDLPYGEFDDC